MTAPQGRGDHSAAGIKPSLVRLVLISAVSGALTAIVGSAFWLARARGSRGNPGGYRAMDGATVRPACCLPPAAARRSRQRCLALIAEVGNCLAPELALDPTTCAIVGMAAFVAAVVQTPPPGGAPVLRTTCPATPIVPMLVACLSATITPYLLNAPRSSKRSARGRRRRQPSPPQDPA